MLKKIYQMQFAKIFRGKNTTLIYWSMIGIVSVNFLLNLANNANKYTSQMFEPVKILTLSSWSQVGYVFMLLYPILIAIPTATSYIDERDCRVMLYLQARAGRTKYWAGKMCAVFTSTFLIFTIPFVIEIILSNLCFSEKALGDPSNLSFLKMAGRETDYLFLNVYLEHPKLYAWLYVFFFGTVSAILAMFNFAISVIAEFKYRIMTFLPIYILLYALSWISKVVPIEFTTNYFFILRMFDQKPKNMIAYIIFLILLVIISVVLIGIRAIRDEFV